MTITAAPAESQPDAPISVPGYAMPPNAILRDARLSITARLLYAVLDGRRAGNKAHGIRVSVATLAADMGCGESTVRRVADELTAAGWLARRRTGRSSSWLLTNPVRAARSAKGVGNGGSTFQPVTAQERADSLTDSGVGTLEASTPPIPAATAPDLVGTTGTTGARSFTGDRSECSPVSALQSITREKDNNTADRDAAPASGGQRGGASQRGTGDETSAQESPPRTGAQHPAACSGREESKAKTKTKTAAPSSDPLTARYVDAINSATGARLRPTRQLRELLGKIAAKGIPADEAAMTAAAWLAVKGGKITSPEGFLAAIALPSMAEGQELDNEPPKATPTPPAFHEIQEAPRCAHGAEAGRCALCRREAASPPAQKEPGAFAQFQRDNYRRAMERAETDCPPPWIAQEAEQYSPLTDEPGCYHGQPLGSGCPRCAEGSAEAKAAAIKAGLTIV